MLVGIGLLLIAEGFLSEGFRVPFPAEGFARFVLSLMLGGVIGVVAALLGVAGGELLIPTLVFMHGLDVKAAGTASLVISICVVSAWLLRYRAAGRLPSRGAITDVALPMAAGSVLGALFKTFLAAFVSSSAIKIALGAILDSLNARGLRARAAALPTTRRRARR